MNHQRTQKPFWLVSVLILAALVMAACQPAAATTPAPAATQPPAATEEPMATEAPTAAPTEEVPVTGDGEEPTLMVSEHPDLGPILVDGEGMTLYMFTKDEPNKSNCSGGCLENWPPLVTQGSPVAGEGVDEALIGSADLPDGQKIVTYNEMPLYYWVNDTAPGQATGQNVNEVWFVVSPEGEIIREMPGASSTGGEAAAGDATLMVAEHPDLGPILVDSKGMTLYMFTKDEPDKVNCEGKCLEAWPPLLVEGEPVAGEGVDASMLGTADMPDGTKIVTYNHMPLYYWAADTAPGQATGQDVNQVWYVVSPEGEPIGMP